MNTIMIPAGRRKRRAADREKTMERTKGRRSSHVIRPTEERSILHEVLRNQHNFFKDFNHNSPEHLRILDELSNTLLEISDKYDTLSSNHNSTYCEA